MNTAFVWLGELFCEKLRKKEDKRPESQVDQGILCLFAKKRKMKTDTKTKEPDRKSVFLKLVEDKKAISECIRMGGDLSKLAKERGLKFAKPL